MTVPAAAVGYDMAWMHGRNGVLKGQTMIFPQRCKHLTETNTCSLHDVKPQFCKVFPENCGPQKWLRDIGCRYFDGE